MATYFHHPSAFKTSNTHSTSMLQTSHNSETPDQNGIPENTMGHANRNGQFIRIDSSHPAFQLGKKFYYIFVCIPYIDHVKSAWLVLCSDFSSPLSAAFMNQNLLKSEVLLSKGHLKWPLEELPSQNEKIENIHIKVILAWKYWSLYKRWPFIKKHKLWLTAKVH